MVNFVGFVVLARVGDKWDVRGLFGGGGMLGRGCDGGRFEREHGED